jgi:hypothetical protein
MQQVMHMNESTKCDDRVWCPETEVRLRHRPMGATTCQSNVAAAPQVISPSESLEIAPPPACSIMETLTL